MDEELPKMKLPYQVGQDLALLSQDELREAVEMLRAEIARIEEAIGDKSASRDAAEAFFRL